MIHSSLGSSVTSILTKSFDDSPTFLYETVSPLLLVNDKCLSGPFQKIQIPAIITASIKVEVNTRIAEYAPPTVDNSRHTNS